MAAKVPSIMFNNGIECPQLGLGCARGTRQPAHTTQAVKDAIDMGYRHFDCAFIYGNEIEVGLGVKAKIEEGVVKREELFINSKLWVTFMRADLVIPALKNSLKNLGLDYLDMYLIHWPFALKEGGGLYNNMDGDINDMFSESDYADTWKAMEKAVKAGLVKSIGLSNFNSEQIERVLAVAEIKPVTNQIECHPYLNQNKLMAFCKSKGITVTAYSPLGNPDRPWAKPGDTELMDDVHLKNLAEKKRKSVAQILIRYQLQRGNIVIPKSITKSRIEENFDIFDFELSAEDMSYIDTFDCNGRFVHCAPAKRHKNYPFNIEY